MTPIAIFLDMLAVAGGIACIMAVFFAYWCLWMYMIGAGKGRE